VVQVSAHETTRRQESIFTARAFGRLLEWLDEGGDSHGERYVEMRRRLVSYFDRRNRPAADELADETLNRVARTLEEAGVIETTPPARYCYVIARFVLLEDFRRERRQVRFDSQAAATERTASRIEPGEELAMREGRFDCLERCLAQLPVDQRELVIEYYRDARQQGIDRRRQMADRLSISRNALGVRAFRIREALMKCVESGGPQPCAPDLMRSLPIRKRHGPVPARAKLPAGNPA
jgi:DNA-directed RNA polymerase specialized sigma24 family protein